MNDFWCSLISMLVSILVGAGVSIVTTIITQGLEHKKNKETAQQQHKYEIEILNRQEKKELYVSLCEKLNDLSIEINVVEESETCQISTEQYKTISAELNSILKQNSGLIMLYMPNDIYTDLLHLQTMIYSYSQKEYPVLSINEANMELLLKEKEQLFELLKKAFQIIGKMKKDINSDDYYSGS